MGNQEELNINLVELFFKLLGQRNPIDRLEKIKKSLRNLTTSSNGFTVQGENIFQELQSEGGAKDKCRDLIHTCLDFPNGLDILRMACKYNFTDPNIYKSFEECLLSYASFFDSQQEFLRDMKPPEADDLAVKLDWIELLDDYTALNQVKQVVFLLSKPGESLFSVVEVELILHSKSALEIRCFLRELLRNNSTVIDEFRSRLREPGKSEHHVFLHILVEPDLDSGLDTVYRFQAELYQDGVAWHNIFDKWRNPDGIWPSGSIDLDFPRLLGQWLDEANQISPCPIYIEIFLPHKLLVESPELKIELPLGDAFIPLKLSFCGRPVALRSMDRARKAKSSPQGLLRNKWERIYMGSANLHPVIQSYQLTYGLLNSRLGRGDVAGVMMLLDLPLDPEQRSDLFWMIIHSGIPICAWWNCLRSDDLSGLPGADEMNSRLSYFIKCLEISTNQDVFVGDIPAPNHLHSMECAADKRLALASEDDCQSWIHRVMILHDHPDRWPQSILYEQEQGGVLQSPI
jgi:hypothetical protein